MFNDMDARELRAAIEALLFVSDEPVGAAVLAEQLECDLGDVEAALHEIERQRASDGAGVILREVAGGWRFYTSPAYHDLIEKYVLSWDTRKLSNAAMETLAIIAYTQPVTRAGVASVRGVNSDSSINSLIEKGLVKESGQADTPGNPTLYSTTNVFLEKFGLRSIKDMTPLEEFAPDAETRALIADRLRSTHTEPMVVVDEEAANAALAAVTGVVEKIDFDSLEFNFDDE